MMEKAIQSAVEKKFITYGDLIVITAGASVHEAGTTNMMKVRVVDNVATKRSELSDESTEGKVVIAGLER
ncbi:Pyruvate kinase [compost metagenome]